MLNISPNGAQSPKIHKTVDADSVPVSAAVSVTRMHRNPAPADIATSVVPNVSV